jgi:DNA (cytosine-5)-methyltransferase 1
MKVVSLFSGAGGLDLGFIEVGHEIVWANDNFEDAVNTYRFNIGDHIILKDIEEIASGQIPDCDIVIGGFPCQGFSVANMKRDPSDTRNKLYKEMLRIIKDKRPAFFLAENVKGILSLGKGMVLEVVLTDFRSCGYKVKYKVLNAADYGVPQNRERVFFLGIRSDLQFEIDFPSPTHDNPASGLSLWKKPWVTIGEALRNIPEPEDAPNLPNHTYSKYKLRFNKYLGHRTIDPNKPAPTVTARGDGRGGVVVLHHPKNHRRMSARELAITQSFPVNYVFSGARSSVYRQIGNAVPPLLAKALASIFPMEALLNKAQAGDANEAA